MAEYINRERARFEAKRYFKNMDEIQEDLDMLFCMLPAENVAPVQEWVSVDDELPEDNSDVLAYSRSGEESRIYLACYSHGVWFDCVFNAPATDTTTHWMPLPEPPKMEKKEK